MRARAESPLPDSSASWVEPAPHQVRPVLRRAQEPRPLAMPEAESLSSERLSADQPESGQAHQAMLVLVARSAPVSWPSVVAVVPGSRPVTD